MDQTTNTTKYAFYAGILLAVCGSLLALTYSIGETKSWKRGASQGPTITVSGEGEAAVMPDIATITFTVRETAKTVAEAQKAVEATITGTTADLTKLGIADKDVKTLSYNVNPKYEGQVIYCITVPCPTGTPKLVGYEVSESIQVKVRKIDAAGDVLSAVGKHSVSDISGPQFSIDDMNKVVADAKAKAVADAKAKAKVTANALGVDLGDIVGYSEDGGYNPYPVYMMKAQGGATMSTDSVTLPVGETTTKVRVTITYEID
jgi:uncharacterized protein YggE